MLTKEASNLKITVTPEPEDLDYNKQGYDQEVVNAIKELRKKSIWGWCSVKVTVSYGPFSATEYLGGCSYKNKKDFMQEGGYYSDMVNTCLAELNTELSLFLKNYQTDTKPCQASSSSK